MVNRVKITWEEVEDAIVERLKWRQAAAWCAEMHKKTGPKYAVIVQVTFQLHEID